MRSLRNVRTAIAAGLAAGCQSLADPPLPQNAEAISPPAAYADWWAMTEACSGLSAPLGAVHWYLLPGAALVPYEGGEYASGYWSRASNRIVLAGQDLFAGPVVRHEMLHALLQRGGHPRADFVVRCAGLVECDDQCLSDAGPAPPMDPSIPVVPTSTLLGALSVSPGTPSGSTNDGVFEVTVSVTNPLNTPARVSLPDSSNADLGVAFSCLVVGPFGGKRTDVRPRDASAIVFAPHERKVQVFDFRVGTDSLPGMWRPGAYQITGEFGVWSGPSITTAITLTP